MRRIWAEIFRMAVASLGVHKLRTFLTVSGITIGVFSVIGVMTAVSAVRGSIESGLSFLGANIFQFAKYPSVQFGGDEEAKVAKRRDITLAQAQRYARLMEGTADVVCMKAFFGRSPTAPRGAQVVYGGRKTPPGITYCGTNEHFLAANQFSIALGRNLTSGDVELARPVIVIGTTVLKKLFPSENPLGKMVRVNGNVYAVVGTFEEKGSSFGDDQDSMVIVPITRFLNDNGAQGYTVNIATQAPSAASYNDVMEKGVTAMRIVRGLRPADENDFEIYSNDSLLAAFGKIADAVRAGAFLISAIALVAAGVGIMNIMLVSVTERTREIGIRKSIGARRAHVLFQFLAEAFVISLLGGVAGIVTGVAAGNALALALHASVVFPWGWAAAGLIVCCGIGVGFGFYPAMRAAALDPIEALRYE
jgi:putative ABC transport system permease protein